MIYVLFVRRPQELRIRYDDTLGPPLNIVDWLCDAADSPPAPELPHRMHLTSTPSSIYPPTGSSLAITYHFWHISVALPSLLLRLPACLLRLPLPRNAGLLSLFLLPAQHAGPLLATLLAACCQKK